jgi:hypothetical protein
LTSFTIFPFLKHIYHVCIPAPIAYIQLSETCQLDVQHAHVNHCYVEALLTQGKVSSWLPAMHISGKEMAMPDARHSGTLFNIHSTDV